MKIFRLQKLILLFILTVVIVGLTTVSATNEVLAWFGAGKTPGWPATTLQLSGEMSLPTYKFSPDFYRIGDSISFDSVVTNMTDERKDFVAYLVISRVIEAPLGENVTDGDPDNPGLNENQLYDFHQANNDLQEIIERVTLGAFSIEPQGSITIPAQFTAGATGYYQFDITHRDPQQAYEPGHILTAGFFRVLPQAEPTPSVSPSPTVSPSPSPTATPTPTATPVPTVAPQVEKRARIALDGPSCSNNQFKVVFDLTDPQNNDVGSKIVRFNYKGDSREANTNQDGRAEVWYTFSGPADVQGQTDGYPSQSIGVQAAQNCSPSDSNSGSSSNGNSGDASSGSVLGAQSDANSTVGRGGSILGATTEGSSLKQRTGQVLGASTLAHTGRWYSINKGAFLLLSLLLLNVVTALQLRRFFHE